VIRDLAPFAYLALVPLLAISLTRAQFPWLLWTVRVAALLHLAAVAALTLGLLAAFPSDAVGGGVDVFYYRGDLQGIALGLGLISWGTWAGAARGNRVVQFAFLIGGLQFGSRASVVTFAIAVGISLWRERRLVIRWKALIALSCALPAAAFAPALMSGLQHPVDSQVVPSPVTTGFSRLIYPQDADEGTGRARIETYQFVVSGLTRDGLWVTGAGPGTDILYEMCTGIASAPRQTVVNIEGKPPRYLPKCPIDDTNAPTVLRDPHQWLLGLLIYNGAIGTLVFLGALALPMWAYRKAPDASLALTGILLYFVCGSFGVVISSSFGMLPVAVMLAWLISSSGVLTDDEGPRSLPA
jgi:hypothetical protein